MEAKKSHRKATIIVLSIKEALAQAKRSTGSGVFGHCAVCSFLETLSDEEDREALNSAIRYLSITRPEIQRIMLDNGYSVSLSTISTHRTKCYRGDNS